MKPEDIGKYVSATLIALAASAGSVSLKVYEIIGEPTLLVLLVASLLLGLFIAYADRVHSLKISEMELTLKEAKEVEASVRELARAILDVFESKSHGLMLESYDAKKAEDAMAELKRLIA